MMVEIGWLDFVLSCVTLATVVSALLVGLFIEYKKTDSLKKTFEAYFFVVLAVVCMGLAVATRLIPWAVLGLACLLIDDYLERKKKKKEEEPTLL